MSILTNEMRRTFDLYYKTTGLETYTLKIKYIKQIDANDIHDQYTTIYYRYTKNNDNNINFDDVIDCLPNPYNKNELRQSIYMITINADLVSYPKHINITVYVDIENETFKTKAGQSFERELLYNNEITETLSFKENASFFKTLASKTGMKNSYKQMLEIMVQSLLNQSLKQNETSNLTTAIFDNTYDVHDYETDLYTMVIDYSDDFENVLIAYKYQLQNSLFNNKLPVDTIQLLLDSIYVTYLLSIVDTEKIKVLISYILKYQPDHVSILDLFDSNIPNNLITSSYMPNLNLNKIIL